jgi:flavodoxin
MNIAIRYYSKTGNTQKLAQAISKELNIPAERLDVPLGKTDILFLGSSVYGGTFAPAVREFLENLKPNQVSRIVVFGTAAILKSTYRPIKKLAEKKGLVLSDQEFHCRGQAGKFHKDRPNEADLKAVSEFAKTVIKG